LASDRAFAASYDVKDRDTFERYKRSAKRWDDEGMRANPYNSEVCYNHVRILQEEAGGIYGGISFWRDVVLEREFWNPDRRVVMAQLYLRAGMISKAIGELPWLPGGDVRKKVEAAKQLREKANH